MANRKRQNRSNQKKSNNSAESDVLRGVNGDGNVIDKARKKRKPQPKQQKFLFEKDYRFRLQEVLYSSEHILSKIFRKDGPPLGDEFDSLPPHAFLHCKKKDSKNVHRACQEYQRVFKRRKLCSPTMDPDLTGEIVSLPPQTCRETTAPVTKHGIGKGLMTVKGALIKAHGIGKGLMAERSGLTKKHGIGKGLMTVWQLTDSNAADLPAGIGLDERRPKEKKKKTQRRQVIPKKLLNRSQDKKKTFIKNRKVDSQNAEKRKQPWKEKCELALEALRCQDDRNQYALLVDDEELELRELQTGPDPLMCSAHLTTNGVHGCPLCKDLLAKFPPNSVTMRLPLYKQPWDSSPELVKKLFKVFHFLCTYAVKINITAFTLDEFAQAFIDKDSLLLGHVHVDLLKLLFSDVEVERTRGILSHASKNRKFLGLLHSVESQEFVLEFWKESLNPLTWAEILRQVLVAAGYGSKHGALSRKTVNKETSLMEKYGLSPATLKGELFSLLLTRGSRGMKVSELALSAPLVDLNLAPTTDDLETLISSTLATDITLFEKISSSGYRLRVNSSSLEYETCGSDSHDFGSVHDNSEVSSGHNSCDDSECEPDSSPANARRANQSKDQNNMLTVYTEIDESNPGEAWLLGLMEGEYSDLNVEEKLNALVALTDLLSAGSSIRMEEPMTSMRVTAPNIYHNSSGAKIKRSTAQQFNTSRELGSYGGQMLNTKDDSSMSELGPIDSVVCMSTLCQSENLSRAMGILEEADGRYHIHPMQSIFLGSDRRYNRYWLFLGPCDRCDPGHKRIYFESSEDGHWEVIDTEDALSTLLSALDRRGTREAFLLASIEKREAFLSRAMSSIPDEAAIRQSSQSDLSELNMSREESSSAVSDVDNLALINMQNDLPSNIGEVSTKLEKKGEQQKDALERIQAFDAWVWKSFYSDLNSVKHGKRSYIDSLTRCSSCHDLYWRDEKHCKICHKTFQLDFDLEEKYAIHAATCRNNTSVDICPRHKVLSSKLQSLKAATYAIEKSMPDDALGGAWRKFAHNLWVSRLRRASTLTEFLQVLADFVSAISEDWLYQLHNATASSYVVQEILSNFPAMPQTSSAIALWLVKLDVLVASHLEKDTSKENPAPSTRSKGKRVPSR